MKINDSNLQGPGGLGSTGSSQSVSKPAKTGRTGASAPVPTTGDADDGVALSGLAQTLSSLGADSPDRQAKVDALAKAYAQGSYQVNAGATAGGIIQDALDHK
jgi:flagellar biosynthesis anti-sigma factor FlgM